MPDPVAVEVKYDPALGKQGFEAMQAQAEELTDLTRITADTGQAVTNALMGAETIEREDVAKELALFDERLLNPAFYKELRSRAWALWYCDQMLGLAVAEDGSRMLPVGVVNEATTVRNRMYKVASHNLEEENDELGAVIRRIRAGSGYKDLRSDLMALATLYEEYKDLIANDRFYRAEDVRQAQAYISQFIKREVELDTRLWTDRRKRCWTLLHQAHNTLHNAIAFAFSERPEIVAAFPSLHAQP